MGQASLSERSGGLGWTHPSDPGVRSGALCMIVVLARVSSQLGVDSSMTDAWALVVGRRRSSQGLAPSLALKSRVL